LNRKKIVKQTLIIAAICAVLATTIIAHLAGYYIAYNDTDSFAHRWYLAKRGALSDVQLGDLAIFTLASPPKDYRAAFYNRRLFKQIACAEGDYLKRVNDVFICNDKEIAVVRKTDSKGREITAHFYYDGVIPKNNYFVVAPHYQSFDSRYFGLIQKEAIEGKMICELY
jgi:type IV secretory pathway protease TraF